MSINGNDFRQRSIAAIILAAGSSSRMGEGRHKLQLPIGGRPVLAHVVETVLASQARPVVVVLGHEATQVRALLADEEGEALTIVENPDYRQGMSTSIHAGVRALLDNPGVGGALIVLGDQPLMTTHIIDSLIEAKRSSEARIVAPLYEGKRGSPVLFDANLFAELLQVTGDQGGREVLERYRADMLGIEVGSPRVGFDVDTWEAYQQVVQEWQNNRKTT